jgi:hypothetical protein
MEDWIAAAKRDEFAPGERRVVEAKGTSKVAFNLDGKY